MNTILIHLEDCMVHLPNIIDTTENHSWNWYKYAIHAVNSPIFRAIFCLSMVTVKKQVNKHHGHAFNKTKTCRFFVTTAFSEGQFYKGQEHTKWVPTSYK